MRILKILAFLTLFVAAFFGCSNGTSATEETAGGCPAIITDRSCDCDDCSAVAWGNASCSEFVYKDENNKNKCTVAQSYPLTKIISCGCCNDIKPGCYDSNNFTTCCGN